MKRWLYVLVPLAVLFALIGWRINVKRTEAAAQNKMREMRRTTPPSVAVVPATVRDITHTFEGVGSVEAPLNVKITPKVTGRIDYLQVREGDHVTRGQVLVRLDPSEVEAQVRQQQANVAEAQSRLAQAQINQAPTNVSVSTQIRQQQAAVASAQADYDQARENYNAQLAAAAADVTDAQGRVDAASAAIANAQAAIQSAQANLDNARSKYNRVNDLYKQGFIAAQDVDDARTAVSVQQGALDVARGQLNAATAQRDSAQAQKQSAQHQADIVKTKGKADIEAARAKVTQAKAALDYAKANTAQRPAYQANIAALKAAVAAAQAQARNAQAQLANTVLTSPLDGFVTGRYLDPGAMAAPSTPVLAVQAIRQVWVTVPVPEEISRKIYQGQPASVTLDALPGRTFTGKVSQINPAADPASRQFSVRVTLDNARNLLKPGMFARVEMVTDRIRGALVVPREAVKQGPDGAYAMVVSTDNKAERRPVQTGASDNEGVAIVSGLQPGEKVVTLSAMPVREGQTVRMGGSRPGGRRRQ